MAAKLAKAFGMVQILPVKTCDTEEVDEKAAGGEAIGILSPVKGGEVLINHGSGFIAQARPGIDDGPVHLGVELRAVGVRSVAEGLVGTCGGRGEAERPGRDGDRTLKEPGRQIDQPRPSAPKCHAAAASLDSRDDLVEGLGL